MMQFKPSWRDETGRSLFSVSPLLFPISGCSCRNGLEHVIYPSVNTMNTMNSANSVVNKTAKGNRVFLRKLLPCPNGMCHISQCPEFIRVGQTYQLKQSQSLCPRASTRFLAGRQPRHTPRLLI